VQDRTEGQAIVPRGTEVGDVNVAIAHCLVLAPLQQGVALGASILGQHVQRILAFPCKIYRISDFSIMFHENRIYILKVYNKTGQDSVGKRLFENPYVEGLRNIQKKIF